MVDLEDKIKKIAEKYGQDVIRIMILVVNIEGSNFINNLKSEVRDDLTLVLSYPEYGKYINDGRKPNSKMPPPGVLTDWMKRKGIPEKAEFGIAKSIAKNGIKARPFLDAFDISIGDYVEDVSEIYEVYLADKVESLLKS